MRPGCSYSDTETRLPPAGVQPGYEDDPGQAVYNRVWILGDEEALSVQAQARLDQITELIPVQVNAP